MSRVDQPPQRMVIDSPELHAQQWELIKRLNPLGIGAITKIDATIGNLQVQLEMPVEAMQRLIDALDTQHALELEEAREQEELEWV